MVRDAVHDLNKAVGRRWQGLDRFLPGRADLPQGCAAPLVAAGANGRPAGLGVCRHQFVPADTLNQTWGSASQFSLILRLREPDTSAALDELLAQWRDHLAGLPEAGAADTAAMVTWPTRDVSGVNALLRRGMQAMTVIAVRPAEHAATGPAGPASAARDGEEDSAGLVIREARPGDLDAVTEFEMGVIRYDAQFGAAIENPARGALIIMPIAHLSVTSGFRRPEVSISSFIVCIHAERISVFLRRSARCFSESACERSLIRGSSLVRKKRVHDGGSLCRLPGCYRSSDSPFIAAGVILVIEIEMVVGQELHNFCYRL